MASDLENRRPRWWWARHHLSVKEQYPDWNTRRDHKGFVYSDAKENKERHYVRPNGKMSGDNIDKHLENYSGIIDNWDYDIIYKLIYKVSVVRI